VNEDYESFLNYFERIRERTLRVARCIPQDRLEWSPNEGKFSFADLLRHLAGIERYMYAENAKFRPSRYSGHGKELADGYDEVFQFLECAHQESMEIFRSVTDEDLQKKCTVPSGQQITLWKWLRAMIEHEVHHRGQIYLYLQLLNIPTPPLYGLTSEEVKARSVR
jgi:uncharacterized damage-inducible protein DinB